MIIVIFLDKTTYICVYTRKYINIWFFVRIIHLSLSCYVSLCIELQIVWLFVYIVQRRILELFIYIWRRWRRRTVRFRQLLGAFALGCIVIVSVCCTEDVILTRLPTGMLNWIRTMKDNDILLYVHSGRGCSFAQLTWLFRIQFYLYWHWFDCSYFRATC